MAEMIYSLRLENLKVHAMLDIKRDRVNNLRLHMSLSQEEFRQIRRDRDDTQGRLRRTMTITRSGMTPESIEELINRCVEEALAAYEAAHGATALETKNQSQNDSDGDSRNGNGRNGNDGNGNGRNENLYENVRGDRHVGLIRWFEKMETMFHISNCPEKSQVKYATCTLLDGALTWNEIQKIETELWNLTVKNNDLIAYTLRFQELTMMRTKMVPEEEDRVEKFIGCLPDNIQGNVIAAEPTRLKDAVRIANNLMDQKLKGYAVRNAENKRRLNNHYGNNCGQQPPHKRQNTGGQNVARAYMAGNNEKNGYEGTLSFCNKWIAGHYQKDYPKVKNQNCGNIARVPDAIGKAYVLGGGDANPGSNTVTDVSYAIELADGRTLETNTMLRGYTLGLLGHPFNIDLMPIDLGSFDVIIGMDWLAKNHAVIVCDEKIVCIPYGNEILIIQRDKSDKEWKSTLTIISCVKAQKYMEKGCQLFLAQVTVKENKDESKEKRLKDVPTVWDFWKFFQKTYLDYHSHDKSNFRLT
ncbi:reverse transcriptase domain-containing protein [Tanacetum coccineum]|uniref:Reverse transcriptase domain-containing protein n=1 Tax=Tanacetum coccineum TaxID=301880 RepID=A0ABQ5DJ68_9ASTR